MKAKIFQGTYWEVQNQLDGWLAANPRAWINFAMQTQFAQEIIITLLYRPWEEVDSAQEVNDVVLSASTQ